MKQWNQTKSNLKSTEEKERKISVSLMVRWELDRFQTGDLWKSYPIKLSFQSLNELV